MRPMLVELESSAHLAGFGGHAGEEFVHIFQGRLQLEQEGRSPGPESR